jgi:N-acyl-D-aspartate/D-glutamate deacylase
MGHWPDRNHIPRLGQLSAHTWRYVRDEKLLSLEAAIHKMTGRPRVSAEAIAD